MTLFTDEELVVLMGVLHTYLRGSESISHKHQICSQLLQKIEAELQKRASTNGS